MMRGDDRAAVQFLEQWLPGGPWVLTAITTDRKAITTNTFTDSNEVLGWLAKYNGERNVYFHVNPCTRALTKKADREDVAALAWLHVDIDPRPGEEVAEEQKRALMLLTERLPESVPPPTCVVFSGGGYQGFWKLEEPLPIDGSLEVAEDAKLWNLQLEILFGADNCHNVDRIMRLPGTVNLPDSKKRKKGREPELARLVYLNDTTYPLTAFRKAQPVQTMATQGFTPTSPNNGCYGIAAKKRSQSPRSLPWARTPISRSIWRAKMRRS